MGGPVCVRRTLTTARIRKIPCDRVSEASLLPWWEKVRMRGITLVTLTSILSHQGRGGMKNHLLRQNMR